MGLIQIMSPLHALSFATAPSNVPFSVYRRPKRCPTPPLSSGTRRRERTHPHVLSVIYTELWGRGGLHFLISPFSFCKQLGGRGAGENGEKWWWGTRITTTTKLCIYLSVWCKIRKSNTGVELKHCTEKDTLTHSFSIHILVLFCCD